MRNYYILLFGVFDIFYILQPAAQADGFAFIAAGRFV